MQKQLNRKLHSEVLSSMAALVREHMKAWLREAEPNHTAVRVLRQSGTAAASRVACAVVLERILHEIPVLDLCREIGTRLEQVVYSRQSKDSEAFDRRLKRLVAVLGVRRARYTKMKGDRWPYRMKLSIGHILLYWVAEWTGMVEMVTKPDRTKRSQKIMVATEECLAWLGETDILFSKDADNRRPAAQPSVSEHPQIEIRDAVSKTNNLAWRVNRRVFGVLETCFERGIATAGLPDGRKPELPLGSSKKDWARNQAAIWQWITKRRRVASHVAQVRSAPENIYYSWGCDFRGRISPRTRYLSPHGSDLGKGLLELVKGQTIGDNGNYLAHHGANCWGLSKTSYANREMWIDEATMDILRVVDDPLDYRFWQRAKDPWSFLAFCFEWAGWVKDKHDHITHLPCRIDGTCNVAQIIALLMRDEELSMQTNLAPMGSPVDWYESIAKSVDLKLREHDPWGWLELCTIDRSVVKGAAIVCCMGGSAWSAGELVKEWFWKQDFDFPFGGKVAMPCMFLSKLVHEGVTNYSAVDRIQKWFRKVAKEVHGPVRWTSPVDLPIEVAYHHRERIGNVRDTVKAWATTGKFDYRKTATALLPNYIQSLDAAAMIRVVNGCSFDVVPTHDCFGALATNISELHRGVRDIYSELFYDDLLADFASQVGAHNSALPIPGVFKPADLTTAPYCFT